MSFANKIKSLLAAGVLTTSGCITFEVKGHAHARTGTREYRAYGEASGSIDVYPSSSSSSEPSNNQWQNNYRPSGPNGVAPAFQDPPYVEPRLRYDLRK